MQTLPARANRRHPKTAADAFFLTVFDRCSDSRPVVAGRSHGTSWGLRKLLYNCYASWRMGWHKLCRLAGRIYTPTLPPTAVTPGLRPRPLTGARNPKMLLLIAGHLQSQNTGLKAPVWLPDKGAVPSSEPPYGGGPAGPGQTQRPRPVDEAGSCVWRSAPVFASTHRGAQQKSAKRKRFFWVVGGFRESIQ